MNAETKTYTDQQIDEPAKSRRRFACTLAQQGFHFAPARLGETHGNTGWNTDATVDPEKIKGWLDSGGQLVMVAKFGKCAALDVDNWEGCLDAGFDPKWIEGEFKVNTPSGGFHIYLPWHAAFDAFKGAKVDAFGPNDSVHPIAELKLNNASIAAPGSFRRASDDGRKREGLYTLDGGKVIPCPDAPALAAWFKTYGKAKPKAEFAGNREKWEFHPDFETADFLEWNECCLADGDTEGMFEGSYDLVVESCPLCDKPSRPNSTQTNFLTKFKFGGTGYGFYCAACEVNTRQEFEEGMEHNYSDWTPWSDPIYRYDDTDLLIADGRKIGFELEMVVNDPDPESGTAAVAEKYPSVTEPASQGQPLATSPTAALPTVELMPPDCGEMEVGDYGDDITCTDVANGKRLARFFGNDLCYVVEHKCWYVWDGKKWAEDIGNVKVNRLAKEVAQSIFVEADHYDEEKAKQVRQWACRSCGKYHLDAMREMAISEGTIAKCPQMFDQDPNLFNCQNGVIDLRTGQLLPHNRKHWMMNISPVSYNPSAQCPVWLAHLDKVQRGDAEIIGFLQRLAGYSLCGSSEEETATFLWGDGRNGKGKTLEILCRILGDYATTVPFTTFLEGAKHNAGGASPDIASLAGKRMVVAQESNITGRFNEALLKTLTGRDRQKARHLYQEPIEFMPVFTLWLASNSKPRIIDQSEAMKRRIKLVPFTVQIPEEDVDIKLPEKLWAEREGILAWCVKGSVEWQKKGLCHPAKVREASKEYFADEDSLGQWLKECTVDGRDFESGSSLAYDSFKSFAEENNYFVLDAREFKYRMGQKGYESTRRNKGVIWKGFRVVRLNMWDEPKLHLDALDSL